MFEAGGLNCVLSFIRDSGHLVHKDTLHSAMAVVSRLCSKMEPQDSSLETCVESLSSLLKHEDHQVSSLASSWPRATSGWCSEVDLRVCSCPFRCLTVRYAASPHWLTDSLVVV